jgi:hypothetical protein
LLDGAELKIKNLMLCDGGISFIILLEDEGDRDGVG